MIINNQYQEWHFDCSENVQLESLNVDFLD